MKLLLSTLLIFMIQNSFAATIYHQILEGKMHKGGEIQISVKSKTDSNIVAYLKYQLEKKWYVPIPDKILEGDLMQPLPLEFETEEGYLILEEDKEMMVDKAKLVHLGREDRGEYLDCHKIKIIPDNNKWVGIIYYHPNISSLGWLETNLTLLNLPVVGDYKANSKLK